MKFNRFCGFLTAAVMCASTVSALTTSSPFFASADEWYFAGSVCEPLHDTSRDIQNEGVGNPLNFGERNTPADASADEIKATNHKMTVQEVKYALYKEIDEHWDLISTRLGQTEREKVYALFLGLGTRESTLGEGKIGADHETAYADGFGVNPAHAYGTLQTAVTAFADCNPTFMKEDNVPEMFQYSFNETNFYDAIISNHMGIRKILHFAEICINEEDMHGYQVIRNSLKGFNTGWCYAEDAGSYLNYADEICSMAQFYYYEDHLYDNVFTWTSAGGDMAKYRTDDRWDWWGDGEPSMAPVDEKPPVQATTTTTSTTTTTTTTTSTSATTAVTTTSAAPTSDNRENIVYGDANCDGAIDMSDVVLVMQSLANPNKYGRDGSDESRITEQGLANADVDTTIKGVTSNDALRIQEYLLHKIASLDPAAEQ